MPASAYSILEDFIRLRAPNTAAAGAAVDARLVGAAADALIVAFDDVIGTRQPRRRAVDDLAALTSCLTGEELTGCLPEVAIQQTVDDEVEGVARHRQQVRDHSVVGV